MDVIRIDKSICTGCQECAEVCPAYAIMGEHGQPQEIDQEKCIHCGQCVQKCKAYVSPALHGIDRYLNVRRERNLPETVKEPLFAAYNICHLDEVKAALENPTKITVVHCAPAVRVALCEEFGLDYSKEDPLRLASALKELGFDHVYDANFAADLTIMEEGSELIRRVTKGEGKLPMFTSCCPGWVSYMENNYPELKDNLSSCKSPQQMQGAIEKTYGADILNVNGGSIYTVSVMPCTAKEYESSRDEMWDSGFRDVDVVITTRELAYLIKEKGIDYKSLAPAEYESVMGEYSGAGAIFGVTGGVMEAAIRTGYELITGKEIEKLEINDVRGGEGFRRADIRVGDLTLKVGIVSGLKNVNSVIADITSGKLELDFVEVMACPEGCISGGGQPKLLVDTDREAVFNMRREAIYSHDENLSVRKSHENGAVKKLYDDFLTEPGSEKSHHLLHTEYCIK